MVCLDGLLIPRRQTASNRLSGYREGALTLENAGPTSGHGSPSTGNRAISANRSRLAGTLASPQYSEQISDPSTERVRCRMKKIANQTVVGLGVVIMGYSSYVHKTAIKQVDTCLWNTRL
jgi:hypothetical protein